MRIGDKAKPAIPPVDGGTYLATCVYIIDIGEQLCEFKDKGKSYNNQLVIGFELSGVEPIEIDGVMQPRILSRTFNIKASANAGLRIFLSAWAGKQYSDEDFRNLDTRSFVGKPAMINVVQTEDGCYANISGIMQIPNGFPVPEYSSRLIMFDMDPWDAAQFEALPEWARSRIEKSTEYQKLHAPTNEVRVTPTMTPPAQTMQQGAFQTLPAPQGGAPF